MKNLFNVSDLSKNEFLQILEYSIHLEKNLDNCLKNKNIAELAGIPLVGHASLQARSISQIDKHFVSTDSQEIAAIAEIYGSEIIVRPQELATDNAVEWHAWQHAVKYVMDKYGNFDQFVSLPCTSPLRNNSDIIKCLNKDVLPSQIVISYTDAHRNPWFNLLKVKDSSAHLLEPVCKDKTSVISGGKML